MPSLALAWVLAAAAVQPHTLGGYLSLTTRSQLGASAIACRRRLGLAWVELTRGGANVVVARRDGGWLPYWVANYTDDAHGHFA